MAHSINQIVVYAASSAIIADKYFAATRKIAKTIAEAEIKVVYGGGGVGLMGCLADEILANNGYIKGIIPGFMVEVEWQHKGLSALEIVKDMHERKAKFLLNSDAILALPGGCGTLEELLEVITLKRLGIFHGPIIVFNQDGYYDPLLEMLNRSIEEKFMSKNHQEIWTVFHRAEDFMNVLNKLPQPAKTTLEDAKAK